MIDRLKNAIANLKGCAWFIRHGNYSVALLHIAYAFNALTSK